MNCDQSRWPRTTAGQRAPDGTLTVPCELRLHYHHASNVILTGSVIGGDGHLAMTQTADDLWIARLLLVPGTHVVRLHVTVQRREAPWLPGKTEGWDVDFDVPPLRPSEQQTPELRIWLHAPQQEHHHEKPSSLT